MKEEDKKILEDLIKKEAQDFLNVAIPALEEFKDFSEEQSKK
jgi:hypothetical protein